MAGTDESERRGGRTLIRLRPTRSYTTLWDVTGEGFGSRIDSSYVRRMLPRLASKAGIERRVHPHALRHSLATALAYEGKPLPVITAQLGHSSTAVTDRYLARIGPADLVSQVRDRSRLATTE